MIKMRLPKKLELGHLPITFVSVYNAQSKLQMKSGLEDGPSLFVDLEAPQPEFKVQNSLEMHFGVSGVFNTARLYSNSVRSHIDIYVPIEAVIEFLIDHIDQFYGFYSACKHFNLKPTEINFLAKKKLEGVIKNEVP